MTRLVSFVIATCLLIAAPRIATSHPSSGIHASYDFEHQELYVTVQHPVTDRFEHYVEHVTILKNGTEVSSMKFESQTSRRNQTMPPFKIRTELGDRLEIKVQCNENSLSNTVVVAK